MRIVDLLKPESIRLNAAPESKIAAITQLVELQVKGGAITDPDAYRAAILAREEKGSTAVGEGIAIPHAKSDAVKSPSLAAMTVPQGVDYESLDGEPSNLLFMIAAPPDGEVHLEVLSRLMTLLMDDDFREKLMKAQDTAEFLRVIDAAEQEKYPDEVRDAPAESTGYRVLAVTACPTGIAHTYMAAEALEKAGKTLGISIKVETDGSGGVKKRLTDEDIENCDGIIIAADKTVEMARFHGKKVIQTKVSDGIRIPEKLINRILSGDAPVYTHEGGKAESAASSVKSESFGRNVYKHLMNGVSHMLPFTVSGGLFIAVAFLIDTIGGAPQDSDFGSHLAAAVFFKTIGGIAFNFMIPVLAAYIGKSIADRPGFLVGLVGGELAVLGSTFEKVGGDVSSGFLGALFAGFAGGYLMRGLEKLCDGIPKALNGLKPILIYPLGGLLMIALVMCAVNPFMGMLNTGLAVLLNSMGGTSKVLLGAIVGGMMAIDMGGPVNKAAYVFALGSLAEGNANVMAAVMLGGMIPPLSVALATTFFKSRWNEEELRSGAVNYIMGLSFVTEGVIPYAAADPFRVIPSCIVGAAAGGALSMAFDCTLQAPHGGIFVFAVVGHPLRYVLALVIGSVVGMLMLALLKQKRA